MYILIPTIDSDPTSELGRNSDYDRLNTLLSEREEWAEIMMDCPPIFEEDAEPYPSLTRN